MERVEIQIGSSFSVDALEGRCLMSATVFGGGAGKVWDEAPAVAPVVMSVRAPAVARPAASKYVQVVGTWKGTCKTANSRAVNAISMTITSQRNGAAIGTFAVGPISANQKVVSTAIVSAGSDRGFGVILQGKGFFGSITGALSKNGKEIVGRWACNGPGGWKVGTFVMDLQK